MIGDFLVTFDVEKNNWLKRSSQPWELVKVCGSSSVWFSKPDSSWKGFPCIEFQDENWQIWCFGEFFEIQPQISLILSNPEKFNGNFIIFVYEIQTDHWHIITNRLGTLHAYYASKGRRASFGTFSPAVASSVGCNELDWQAIAGFFKFGFFLGNDTYWQGKKIFMPATHTLIDSHGQLLKTTRYWHWSYNPDTKISFDQAVDQFKHIFSQVMKDHVSNKHVALPLSGGLDSRSTLTEIGNQDFGGAQDLFPYSYGYTQDSVETKIASQLAKARNLCIKTWMIKPYLFDQIDFVSSCSEGFHDITQSRQAYIVNELGLNADYVIAAHWGDVWLDDMGFLAQSIDQNGLLIDIMKKKFSKIGSDILLALFKDCIPSSWEDRLNQNLTDVLNDLGDIGNTDFKVKAWKTQQWSFRWTLASIRTFQSSVFPLLPFYDNRLVNFFVTTSNEFNLNRALQIEYLKRFAPDLAKVRWQVYDANLFDYKNFNSWLIPRRVMKKAARILSPKPVFQRNWEVQFLNPVGKQGLYKWLLSDGLKLHDFVAAAQLEKLLSSFYVNPTAASGYTVSMILTLSTWLERQR